MILGVGESMAVGYVPASYLNDVTAVLPMGLLIIALLILPQAKLTVGRVVRLRPPDAASLSIHAGRRSGAGRRHGLVGRAGHRQQPLHAGLALTIGLAALSLVLLSGYGGQAWLCQFTFMGLGRGP